MTLLRLTPAAATHRGMRRRHNEDAIGYDYPSDLTKLETHGALFIVADGVGGLSAGDKASQMTVDNLLKHYYASDANLSVEDRLIQSIQAVNTDVYTFLNRKGATTLVAVVILGDQFVGASAGDSQIFHLQNNTIMQINEEDVLHSDDADNGALTKAIGYRETIDIVTNRLTLAPNDQILLCSDGLTRYIKDDQLVQLAHLHDPRDSVRRMINQANNSGGADNISAVLVNIGDEIASDEIADHLKRISVRVGVDTDPMMMQDVPSKPHTQIPMARPVSTLDDSILEAADKLENQLEPVRVEPKPQTSPATTSFARSEPAPQSKRSNTTMLIIVIAVVVIATGAVILGIGLASFGNNNDSDSTTEITGTDSVPQELNDDSTIEEASENDDGSLQVGDIIVLNAAVLTKNAIGEDVSSFLATTNTDYLIDTIAEDDEGQLWYLLHDEAEQITGWVAQGDLPTYSIVRD